jgi:two-component system OmpR family response regulator
MDVDQKTKKVCIVEDDAVLRTALSEMCRMHGWEVLERSDLGVDELITLVREENPQVLIVDLLLPRNDGMTLVRGLRDAHSTIPVLALSNLSGSEDLKDDLELLDVAFLNKSSVQLEDVVGTIERLAEKH